MRLVGFRSDWDDGSRILLEPGAGRGAAGSMSPSPAPCPKMPLRPPPNGYKYIIDPSSSGDRCKRYLLVKIDNSGVSGGGQGGGQGGGVGATGQGGGTGGAGVSQPGPQPVNVAGSRVGKYVIPAVLVGLAAVHKTALGHKLIAAIGSGLKI